jgi:hypothetical protein
MKISVFREEVKKIYAKYFDGSLITINYDKFSIYKNVTIHAYLVKDRSEAINGIAQNDLFTIIFSLTKSGSTTDQKEFNKNDLIDDELILSNDLMLEKYSSYYTIKPQNKYLCYSSKSVAFRKSTGNAQKILETLNSYFQRLSQQLHDDIKNDLIHDNHIELLRKRLK